VPGENNVGPIAHDEPLLATGEVLFNGQPVFLVAATTREAARAPRGWARSSTAPPC
jgi:xanthine dehydrogenase large subunit